MKAKERHPSSPSATPRQGKAEGKRKAEGTEAAGKGRKNEHPTSNVEWEYGLVVINREP